LITRIKHPQASPPDLLSEAKLHRFAERNLIGFLEREREGLGGGDGGETDREARISGGAIGSAVFEEWRFGFEWRR
jgi:hypothetical protein